MNYGFDLWYFIIVFRRIYQQVAGQLGHNVTRSELEFFQLFYEILMQCTGILARDEHGHIIHGRNMVPLLRNYYNY